MIEDIDKEVFVGVSKIEYSTFIDSNIFLVNEMKQYQSSYPSPYFYLGKEYSFPYRIGYYKNDIIANNRQEDIFKNCLLTRHHNGFIREQAIINLISLCKKECPLYVYPFIVRLLGEYVNEIWEIIYNNRYTFYSNEILIFIKENNKFMDTNKARGISYWNEYYKEEYKSYIQTPSYQYFKWIAELTK